MSNFVKEKSIYNIKDISFLVKHLTGHRGFIAGGCFKNIFLGEKVKDIDVFFRSEEDFHDAVKEFTEFEDYSFAYESKNVKAFKHIDSGITIELIMSIFGTPEEILNQFDFTITKMALSIEEYDEEREEENIFDISNKPSVKVVKVRYPEVLYHPKFFEHLMFRRLVTDNEIPKPYSTFERMAKYIGYGFSPCKDTKIMILQAIKSANGDVDLTDSLYNGVD